METLPSVTGSIEHYEDRVDSIMRTCLSSFFSSENTLNSNHNFLIKSIIIYVLLFFKQES
jgi:uncharacterized protein Yka (UPF0111/DUF47 family)